jgi:nitrile hydratase
MPARFQSGDRVRVRADRREGHIRTPGYIRGKTGRIEAIHGEFRNPESLAYGGDGFPKQPLYLVAFKQSDVWGSRYRDSRRDILTVDIFEHWLDPVEDER